MFCWFVFSGHSSLISNQLFASVHTHVYVGLCSCSIAYVMWGVTNMKQRIDQFNWSRTFWTNTRAFGLTLTKDTKTQIVCNIFILSTWARTAQDNFLTSKNNINFLYVRLLFAAVVRLFTEFNFLNWTRITKRILVLLKLLTISRQAKFTNAQWTSLLDFETKPLYAIERCKTTLQTIHKQNGHWQEIFTTNPSFRRDYRRQPAFNSLNIIFGLPFRSSF